MMDLETMKLANTLGRMPGERSSYVGLGKRVALTQLDPGQRYDKRQLMAGVSNPEFLKSARMSGPNELTRILKDGRIVVRYYFTDILEVLPGAGMYFTTGGFNSLSTRRHLEKAMRLYSLVAGMSGLRVAISPHRDNGKDITGNHLRLSYKVGTLLHNTSSVFTAAALATVMPGGQCVPDRDLDWTKACAAYTSLQVAINRDYHLGSLCDETA